MTKHYGTKNKGFAKANYNRIGDKLRKLAIKRGKAIKGEGPELTKKEVEYLKRYGW